MISQRFESGGQPVFILSCVRSGSTLLRCIIDTHPVFCSPGHLNLGVLCSNLYMTVYYSLGKLPGVETNKQREMLAAEETRKVVSDLLNRYALGKDKKKWCEKSTANIDFVDILYKIFPDAKFICLYRNSLDVAYSCIKFSALGYMDALTPYVKKYPTNLVEAMLNIWLDKTKKLIDFEQTYSDQCIRVNYESLVYRPEQTVGELFKFLGEEWDKSLLELIFKSPHDQGEGDLKVWFSDSIDSDSVGKGTAMPFAAIPEDLMKEVNDIHRYLGYPTLEELYAEQHREETDQQIQDLDINGFFNRRLSQLTDRAHKSDYVWRGRCRFLISGIRGGEWLIESNSDGVKIIDNDNSSDCVISVAYRVLCELISGKKSPVQAYENGEIIGGGNLIMALELGSMIFAD
ncbi:sulfotransferase [Methylomicrobium lacus]|uniref:sulfotransferase family protein n=1 Tax=Methylomicrobium lacus TaxID=136992 RepID=UPI0035A9125A